MCFFTEKKAKKKEEVKRQFIDSQRSFKIDKDYAHLLLNMWELMKEPKNYLGNGKIYWTDGNISVAERVEKETASTSSGTETDLPF